MKNNSRHNYSGNFKCIGKNRQTTKVLHRFVKTRENKPKSFHSKFLSACGSRENSTCVILGNSLCWIKLGTSHCNCLYIHLYSLRELNKDAKKVYEKGAQEVLWSPAEYIPEQNFICWKLKQVTSVSKKLTTTTMTCCLHHSIWWNLAWRMIDTIIKISSLKCHWNGGWASPWPEVKLQWHAATCRNLHWASMFVTAKHRQLLTMLPQCQSSFQQKYTFFAGWLSIY